MFIIFGTYFFGLKNYAYKIMYCKNCKMPRFFIQTRAFAWGHIMGIPLIPLGYQHNCYCASCRKEDNVMKFSFIIKFLLLLCLLTAYEVISKDRSFGASTLWWQIGLVISIIFSLYLVIFHFIDKKKKAYKNIIPLVNTESCAICNGELEMSKKNKLQCKDCHCYALG